MCHSIGLRPEALCRTIRKHFHQILIHTFRTLYQILVAKVSIFKSNRLFYRSMSPMCKQCRNEQMYICFIQEACTHTMIQCDRIYRVCKASVYFSIRFRRLISISLVYWFHWPTCVICIVSSCKY